MAIAPFVSMGECPRCYAPVKAAIFPHDDGLHCYRILPTEFQPCGCRVLAYQIKDGRLVGGPEAFTMVEAQAS